MVLVLMMFFLLEKQLWDRIKDESTCCNQGVIKMLHLSGHLLCTTFIGQMCIYFFMSFMVFPGIGFGPFLCNLVGGQRTAQ